MTQAVIEHGEVEMVTLALRRANIGGQTNILEYIPEGITLLPNTSGARTAEEAIRIARLAREIGCGDFIKLEIIHDSKYLLPDNFETVKATEILAREGFLVMPYMFPDLNAARHWSMRVRFRSCRWERRLAATKVCAPRNLSVSSWRKSHCRLLLMQGLAGHRRPVKQWKWE